MRTLVPRLLVAWLAAAMACDRASDAPGADLAAMARGDGRPMSAVLALHASECEGNVSMLSVLQLPQVRHSIGLVGVVVLESDARADSLVRRQLRVHDIDARLVRATDVARASLDSLTRGVGPALVVFGDRARVVRILPAPQSAGQLIAFADSLSALAAPTSRH